MFPLKKEPEPDATNRLRRVSIERNKAHKTLGEIEAMCKRVLNGDHPERMSIRHLAYEIYKLSTRGMAR